MRDRSQVLRDVEEGESEGGEDDSPCKYVHCER